MRKTMTPRMTPRAIGTARRTTGRSMMEEEVGGGGEGVEGRVVDVRGIEVRGVEVREGGGVGGRVREEEVRETSEGLGVGLKAGSVVGTDGEIECPEPGWMGGRKGEVKERL